MDARQAIRATLKRAEMIAKAYLDDLTDADLLVRPVPDANHIAWQLGHLITSEHSMVQAALPGTMPPLPAGFAERYTPETAKLDEPSAFHTKAEYLRLATEQRAATLAALDGLTDADLDRPAPEAYRGFLDNLGELLMMQGLHVLMHAGQWAVVRRKLGRKPLF